MYQRLFGTNEGNRVLLERCSFSSLRPNFPACPKSTPLQFFARLEVGEFLWCLHWPTVFILSVNLLPISCCNTFFSFYVDTGIVCYGNLFVFDGNTSNVRPRLECWECELGLCTYTLYRPIYVLQLMTCNIIFVKFGVCVLYV